MPRSKVDIIINRLRLFCTVILCLCDWTCSAFRDVALYKSSNFSLATVITIESKCSHVFYLMLGILGYTKGEHWSLTITTGAFNNSNKTGLWTCENVWRVRFIFVLLQLSIFMFMVSSGLNNQKQNKQICTTFGKSFMIDWHLEMMHNCQAFNIKPYFTESFINILV